MTRTLSIHSLIRDVVEELCDADEREIAKAVVARTPDESITDFYTDALVPLIYAEISNRSRLAKRDVFTPPKRNGRRMPNGTWSSKTKQKTDGWTAYCDKRVKIDGVFKRNGDCTEADLETLIATRDRHIADVQAQNDKDRKIIELLRRFGGADAKLDDIGPTIAETFLQKEAA